MIRTFTSFEAWKAAVRAAGLELFSDQHPDYPDPADPLQPVDAVEPGTEGAFNSRGCWLPMGEAAVSETEPIGYLADSADEWLTFQFEDEDQDDDLLDCALDPFNEPEFPADDGPPYTDAIDDQDGMSELHAELFEQPEPPEDL